MPNLKTIAVVDDDPIYIQALKNLFTSWKILNPVLFFENGKEVLDFIRVKEAPALPDILLLDLNMPVMNGWAFMENFAPIATQLNKNISIYLVTSSIWEEDSKRAEKNPHIKELIVKPILQKKFREILAG
ncbi:response regulator [uncultured Mucilaginibacter sp.]|uniref:response regulator n=1 Tax=uncultured Mucilaginibacter sp. TaxID=797541 RepID=UPI0026167306|nr:response regulator [uncultured Mucilaginibacter sp.]